MNRSPDNRSGLFKGYSLVEMLIVVAIIIILATLPVALLRRAREKTLEAEAVTALRNLSLAYENYWAQNGHKYPNFLSSGDLTPEVDFVNAQHVWSSLIRYSLLPHKYSGVMHSKNDLLARGYYFSIYPADFATLPANGVRNLYAFGLFPYEDSLASRALVMIHGQRFFSVFPSVVPRITDGKSLTDTNIYTIAE